MSAFVPVTQGGASSDTSDSADPGLRWVTPSACGGVGESNVASVAENGPRTPGKIDETVRSLSEHLGWDIRRGQ